MDTNNTELFNYFIKARVDSNHIDDNGSSSLNEDNILEKLVDTLSSSQTNSESIIKKIIFVLNNSTKDDGVQNENKLFKILNVLSNKKDCVPYKLLQIIFHTGVLKKVFAHRENNANIFEYLYSIVVHEEKSSELNLTSLIFSDYFCELIKTNSPDCYLFELLLLKAVQSKNKIFCSYLLSEGVTLNSGTLIGLISKTIMRNKQSIFDFITNEMKNSLVDALNNEYILIDIYQLLLIHLPSSLIAFDGFIRENNLHTIFIDNQLIKSNIMLGIKYENLDYFKIFCKIYKQDKNEFIEYITNLHHVQIIDNLFMDPVSIQNITMSINPKNDTLYTEFIEYIKTE
jgi:hypothetical protein